MDLTSPVRKLMSVVLCGLACACASAPVNLGANPSDQPAAPSEVRLRTASADLVETFAARGWRGAEQGASGAMGLLGRLVGGASAATAEPDPVETYLASISADPAPLMTNDLMSATALVEATSRATYAVAVTPVELGSAALDRDIGRAEAALSSARSARAMFASAAQQVSDPQTEAALASLSAAIEALAVAADTLAERRWASHSRAVG